jgi:hypothetical protein
VESEPVAVPGGDGAAAPDVDASDVDALVAQLQARVEERRRSGFYPDGLEQDMAEHSRRMLHHHTLARVTPDLRGPLRDVESAIPFDVARISADSGVPGGEVIHRGVGKIVRRQTEGALHEVESFARPVRDALAALVAAVESLTESLRMEVDALTERQAALERELAELRGRLGDAP